MRHPLKNLFVVIAFNGEESRIKSDDAFDTKVEAQVALDGCVQQLIEDDMAEDEEMAREMLSIETVENFLGRMFS